MGGDSQKLPTALIWGISQWLRSTRKVLGIVLSRVLDDTQWRRSLKKTENVFQISVRNVPFKHVQ
jgi:hypothetical protein